MDDEPGPRPAEANSNTGKLEGKAAAALGDTARSLDDRFGAAKSARKALRHIFPDHWSFLLGEIALYSFVILLLTGTFLTLFFKPSMSEIMYHGSYLKLDGVKMSEAYSSTLDISFDIRGGLLMRQIHHWAALLFVAAIMIHALRLFFTGAFRKPREINWVIGTVMFILAAMEGFCGYSLPDDLLSGTGLRIADGIILSIPVVGTYLSFFLFGGQYPGESIIPRLYIVHVLILPGLLIALIAAHLMIIWHQGHTQWPGKKQTERNEVGNPLYPVFMAKTGALFFFVFGALTLLGTIAQINPIWLYGPYTPVNDSSLSQPDFYIGFLEGTLRMMPGIESNLAGHTFIWNVFLPAVVFPAAFFLAMGAYPVIEQWATGDRRDHQLLDRPRNAPSRTGIGVAVMALSVDIQLAGADDVIAVHLQMPVEYVLWVFRIGFFVFPVICFLVTRRVCLALQRADRRKLREGETFGIAATEEPGSGERAYIPVNQPLPEDVRALVEARQPAELLRPTPRHLIPLPTPSRISAQVRARLNHFYVRTRLENPASLALLDGQRANGQRSNGQPANGQQQDGSEQGAREDGG
jgi:ubiquinol-cytochrome c reductase cytochrome b subunit